MKDLYHFCSFVWLLQKNIIKTHEKKKHTNIQCCEEVVELFCFVLLFSNGHQSPQECNMHFIVKFQTKCTILNWSLTFDKALLFSPQDARKNKSSKFILRESEPKKHNTRTSFKNRRCGSSPNRGGDVLLTEFFYHCCAVALLWVHKIRRKNNQHTSCV